MRGEGNFIAFLTGHQHSCAWIESLPFTFERQRPFKVYVGLRTGNCYLIRGHGGSGPGAAGVCLPAH